MNPKLKNSLVDYLGLPVLGFSLFIGLWWGISLLTFDASAQRYDFPPPYTAIKDSWKYLAAGFGRNEEQNFNGLGMLTVESLKLVIQGYLLALLIAVPAGFVLGASKTFSKIFDPTFQVLRPVSPLAWYPLAGLVMVAIRNKFPDAKIDATNWQCIITIALCSLWPTMVNTAVGVCSIPVDYLNVAKVLQLGRIKRFTKILLPATLPFMFTGFRLSLGVAWLVIVAVEMLSGKIGIGFFVNDAYSNSEYGAMLMSILVIGVVGFMLDRVMNVIEKNINVILNAPSYIRNAISKYRANAGTAVATQG